jgi:hypothetical protein
VRAREKNMVMKVVALTKKLDHQHGMPQDLLSYPGL